LTQPYCVRCDSEDCRCGSATDLGFPSLGDGSVALKGLPLITTEDVANELVVTRRIAWTAADLMTTDFPEPRWAIEGLIPEGLTVFAGAPKLGKSWLALGLSIAVASGGRALGKIPVDRGPVLHLALEDSARRLKGRLGALLNGNGPPRDLQFFTTWERLDRGGAAEMETWLERHPDTRLVVVDVYTSIRPPAKSSSDSYVSDYQGASELQRVAMVHGVAIVLLYHTRKAEASDFVETIQGTLGTAAAADTLMVARRGGGKADATLSITGRDVNEQNLALRFDSEVGTWTLIGDAAEFALGETRRTILEVVKEHGSLTPKEASGLIEVDYNLAKVTMWRMANDGQLVAVKGRYTLKNPVTSVTLLPDEQGISDRVTPVTPPLGGGS